MRGLIYSSGPRQLHHPELFLAVQYFQSLCTIRGAHRIWIAPETPVV